MRLLGYRSVNFVTFMRIVRKDLRCDRAVSIAGYSLSSEASGFLENFQKHGPGEFAGLRV
jgi:hypothetical protein